MVLARGGEVLAPGTPEDPIQNVDVRDLAARPTYIIGPGETDRYTDRYTYWPVRLARGGEVLAGAGNCGAD